MSFLSIGGVFPRAKPAVDALADHLSKDLDAGKRQVVTLLPGGVSGDTLHAKLRRLAAMAAGIKSKAPLLHTIVSPSLEDAPLEAQEVFLDRVAESNGTQNQPRMRVRHDLIDSRGKRGIHLHEISLRRTDAGKVANIGNNFLIMERIAVEVARDFGLSCPAIAHPDKVHDWLVANGRTEAADWLLANFPRLPDPPGAEPTRFGPRRKAKINRPQRQQQIRTGIQLADVERDVLAAWQASDSAEAFSAALLDRGLWLGQGGKTVQLLDRTGATHDLARTLGAVSKASDLPRISAPDVRAKIAGLRLSSVNEVRALIRSLSDAPQAPKAEVEVEFDLSDIEPEAIIEAAEVQAAPTEVPQPEQPTAPVAPARSRLQAPPPVSRDARNVLDEIMRDWPGRKVEPPAAPAPAPEPKPEVRNRWSGMPSDDELAEIQKREPKPAASPSASAPVQSEKRRLPPRVLAQLEAVRRNPYAGPQDFTTAFQIAASGGDPVMLAWMREQARLAQIELERSRRRVREEIERERLAAARAEAARAGQGRAPMSSVGDKLRQQRRRHSEQIHVSATVQRTTVTATSVTVEELTVTAAVWRQLAESRRGLVARALDWIADGAATVAQDMRNHAEYSKRVAAEDAAEESRFDM
ncbi:hypothetical protein [Roseicella frigidaeris]|nr:hypothetical protein [Roseicella frigidaeris]